MKEVKVTQREGKLFTQITNYKQLFTVFMLLLIVGCEGKEGPVGPQGPQGPQGEQGRVGPQGFDGQSGTDGATLYLADFSSTDDIFSWSKQGNGSYRIEGGRLIVRGGFNVLQQLVSGTQFSDNIDVTVTTQWLNGVDGAPYGILFYRSDNGGYGFGITANGGFIISRWDQTVNDEGVLTPITLVPFTGSAEIQQRAQNILRVLAVEGIIRLFINGAVVGEIFDTTHLSGRIGVFVENNQEVAFDNLFVQPITIQPLRKPVASQKE